MTAEHFDVIIVGAGLSGIDAAYHVQTYCPRKSYVIFEARDAIGGTWDLFRYPGIRSDSDMYTFGYSFRPWESNAAIADGASIRGYIRDTAAASASTATSAFGTGSKAHRGLPRTRGGRSKRSATAGPVRRSLPATF